MRKISISRPRRFECSTVALRIEVNGKALAKLKNDKRIVMQLSDGPQVIRIHGGFMSGKAFQDTVKIPAGQYSYSFQVDLISSSRGNYVPLLRPVSGDFARDNDRTVTLIGAALSKYLLDEKLREGLRMRPGVRLQLVILPQEWQVLLWHEGNSQLLLRSEYSHATGGIAAVIMNAAEHDDLSTPVGRARICSKVLTDYIACLPDYERDGKDGLVFKG